MTDENNEDALGFIILTSSEERECFKNAGYGVFKDDSLEPASSDTPGAIQIQCKECLDAHGVMIYSLEKTKEVLCVLQENDGVFLQEIYETQGEDAMMNVVHEAINNMTKEANIKQND